MKNEGIPVVAFEGINRVGKGTQIDKIKSVLSELKISSVELRGDGTRDGLGLHDGDPLNLWWQDYSKKIRQEGTNNEWHNAAYILAQDLKRWKQEGANLGKEIILLDRSLISRANFVIDRENLKPSILSIDQLYPIQSDNKITIEDILPDVIFELIAPKEILLKRLDKLDPKYDFRYKLINEKYDSYYNTKYRLPDFVQDRIIRIDSSVPVDQVFDSILENLNSRLTAWKEHFIKND